MKWLLQGKFLFHFRSMSEEVINRSLRNVDCANWKDHLSEKTVLRSRGLDL